MKVGFRLKDFNFLQSSFLHDDSHRPSSGRPPLIVVEDDALLGASIKKFLAHQWPQVVLFSSPNQCLEYLANQSVMAQFILVTDIIFDQGSMDGLSLIDLLKEQGLTFVSIAITGFASIETAINATKKGVFKYLTKPFELQVLADLIGQAWQSSGGDPALLAPHGSENISSDPLGNAEGGDNVSSPDAAEKSAIITAPLHLEDPRPEDMFLGIIGRSKKMQRVFERIKKVAATNSTVLISGDSGTGKELVAQAIHKLSNRANAAMVSVNCGAIPNELLESELFGHVKGAFTGAISNRKGRFELASGGTIFLDEIGDMPLMLQVKLLRVLQSKKIEPVGADTSIDVDLRIITATHRDLEKAVALGNFREDLFYRLNVIPIKIPSLAERREDIPLLIAHFLKRFASADGRNRITFTQDALEILVGHSWPGNVRELENLIERLVILRGGSTIGPEDLPAKFLQNRPLAVATEHLVALPEQGLDLKKTISDLENSLITQALERTQGNKNQASRLLQLNRTTLIEKMKKKGLML